MKKGGLGVREQRRACFLLGKEGMRNRMLKLRVVAEEVGLETLQVKEGALLRFDQLSTSDC